MSIKVKPPVILAKTTHKIKKKSYGGFYSEFKMYDVRGKTHAELKAMCIDLKKNVFYQIGRINRLRKVIYFKQKDKSTVSIRDKGKIRTRNRRIAVLEGRINDLKKTIRNHQNAERRYLKMIEARDVKIHEGVKQYNRLERKLNRPIPEVVQKPSKEVSRVVNMLKKPITDRLVNYMDLTIKSSLFCSNNDLTHLQINILLQIGAVESIEAPKIINFSLRSAEILEEKGLVSSSFMGAVRRAKYYFITPKGEEVIKDFKNYLSYGKGITGDE